MSGKDEFQGWIKIWRQIWNNPLWFAEPFTKAQAWIDLLLGANHARDSFEVRGVEIWIERGQIGWSEITMASRWKWSRDKVRRFLVRLESRNQIRQQKSNLTSIITICNYEVYQHIENTSNTANDTPNDTAEKQQKNSKRYTNKNDKNGKNAENEENIPPNPLEGGMAGDASQTESFQLDADQPQPQQPASQPKPKRERKPAQRNPIMDALATYAEGVTDLSQVTPSAWKQIAKAASDIKTVCPTVTAEEIRRRVINYSLSMPNATCTSTAIAKHWARCDDARKPGSTVAETEEEAWARKAAEERKSWGLTPAN